MKTYIKITIAVLLLLSMSIISCKKPCVKEAKPVELKVKTFPKEVIPPDSPGRGRALFLKIDDKNSLKGAFEFKCSPSEDYRFIAYLQGKKLKILMKNTTPRDKPIIESEFPYNFYFEIQNFKTGNYEIEFYIYTLYQAISDKSPVYHEFRTLEKGKEVKLDKWIRAKPR